ncbi:MAG: hypothetical protein U9P90_01870 [Patescibacteria group bacterium]|nr:hypothetical protein [Patescibacteria group bacterium]
MKYFFGILGMIVGFILVWKSGWFLANFGRVDFADKYLGTFGGTRMFYKLLGVLTILICLIWVTGTLDNIIMAVFGPMFSGFKK